MAHLIRACVVVAAVVTATFLPFAAGGYDPLATPLATMAWILGRVGLLLAPIGGLWLWASARPATGTRPLRWLVWVTLAACALILLVMILVAWVSSGVLLAAGTAAIAGLLNLRLTRRLRTSTRTGQPMPRTVPAILALAPIVVLAAQSALVDAVTTFGRSRVIANSSTLIAEIEQYRARHGAYPLSLPDSTVSLRSPLRPLRLCG